MSTNELSLIDLREKVVAGEVEPALAAEESLAAARSRGSLKCFVELRESSPAEARHTGPLAGVPIALKDLFGDEGRAPTAGSRVHATWCTETATVVKRLRAAGAAIVGYSNLHEWAISTTSHVTATGPIRNPWDESLITGGSSGGSAAALAAGLVAGAIGTDAGGSIRVPSACCGTVGLKPTWGVVPIEGYCVGDVPIDHIGPMARSVDDVRVLFEVLADVHVSDVDVSALRMGIARPHFFDQLHSGVGDAVEAAIALLSKVVASTSDVELPGADRSMSAIAALLLPATVRLLEDALQERRDEFDPQTLWILDFGAGMSPQDQSDGLRAREDLVAAWGSLFDEVDVVLTPTIGGMPPPIDDPLVSLPSGRQSCDGAFTALNAPMNAGGVPALSLPCGRVGDLTTNVTLTAAKGREDIVIAVGRALEEALDGDFRNRIVAD